MHRFNYYSLGQVNATANNNTNRSYVRLKQLGLLFALISLAACETIKPSWNESNRDFSAKTTEVKTSSASRVIPNAESANAQPEIYTRSIVGSVRCV